MIYSVISICDKDADSQWYLNVGTVEENKTVLNEGETILYFRSSAAPEDELSSNVGDPSPVNQLKFKSSHICIIIYSRFSRIEKSKSHYRISKR